MRAWDADGTRYTKEALDSYGKKYTKEDEHDPHKEVGAVTLTKDGADPLVFFKDKGACELSLHELLGNVKRMQEEHEKGLEPYK